MAELTQQLANSLVALAEKDFPKAIQTLESIQSALSNAGNPVDLKHLEQDLDTLIKQANDANTQQILTEQVNDDFFVLPPYQVATYPGDGVATPTYVDPDSLQSTTTDWEGLPTMENSLWGAFKGLSVLRLGQLLNIGDYLSSAAGVAASGSLTENLFVQVRTTTYTAEVSNWEGQVFYGPFGPLGDVKAIDFHGLSNTRTMTLEVTKEYRVMAGDNVIYTSSPETITPSKVADYIPNENGFPTHDVYPKK